MASLVSLFLWLVPTVAHAQARGDCVKLLEPFGDQDCIDVEPGLQTWFLYFGQLAPWLYNVAIGIAVLWLVIAGFKITISSDNETARQEAIGQMKAAVLGLLILIFAGPILRTLNSLFFVP